MADVNRGNRPLSPHLEIYRLEWTMALSIMHRITGCALTLGAILVVWWLMAAATGPDYFAFVDGLMTSWIGNLVMLGSLWALCYHTCNGVRHLIWDTGYGFDLATAERTGQIVVVASVVLTVLILVIT
ncbi:MAG: succinate dehydrogenase, cytochrome b556 subunit [Pseudomonadota bacterium]